MNSCGSNPIIHLLNILRNCQIVKLIVHSKSLYVWFVAVCVLSLLVVTNRRKDGSSERQGAVPVLQLHFRLLLKKLSIYSKLSFQNFLFAYISEILMSVHVWNSMMWLWISITFRWGKSSQTWRCKISVRNFNGIYTRFSVMGMPYSRHGADKKCAENFCLQYVNTKANVLYKII